MEQKEFDAKMFDVHPYKRELPACLKGHNFVFEVVPHKKGHHLTPVEGFTGFIAAGEPRSYQQFFELLGWWAAEKVDLTEVNYGFVNNGADFMEFIHWTLHRQDGEEPSSYVARHYYPNGVVGTCTGFYDDQGNWRKTKNDLLIVLRLNGITLAEFDEVYAQYQKAKKAYQASK